MKKNIVFMMLLTAFLLTAQPDFPKIGVINPTLAQFNRTIVVEIYDSLPQPNQSIDLSGTMPPVLCQGKSQGSCSAWAVSYGLANHQLKRRGLIEYQLPGGKINESQLLSPAFVYNTGRLMSLESARIMGGDAGSTDKCNAISPATAFMVAEENGSATWSRFAYDSIGSDACQIDPRLDAALMAHAKNYVIGPSEEIKKNEIVTKLLEGLPVLIWLKIDDSFKTKGFEAGRKKKSKNDRFVWQPIGPFDSEHAMVCVGYDSVNRLYKVFNSWSEKWGIDGYGYIPERHFDSINLKYAAVARDPIPATHLFKIQDLVDVAEMPGLIANPDLNTVVFKPGSYHNVFGMSVALMHIGEDKTCTFQIIDRNNQNEIYNSLYLSPGQNKSFVTPTSEKVFMKCIEVTNATNPNESTVKIKFEFEIRTPIANQAAYYLKFPPQN